MAAEETSLPTDETEAARAASSAAEPYDFALPVTPDELPPAEPPPILLSESWQKPKPPHPSFGWSILWCGLFLLVTQLIPGLGVGFVVFGVQELAKMILPGIVDLPGLFLAGAAVTAVFWPCLRLFGGRGWNRRLASKTIPVQCAFTAAGLAVFVVAWTGLFKLIGDHVLRLTMLEGKTIEVLLSEVMNRPWIVGLLVIALEPAIGEELWCRGFL